MFWSSEPTESMTGNWLISLQFLEETIPMGKVRSTRWVLVG